ncbi:hypothetical protein U1Q18_021282 [Sarracenia purpurea var. burkii]
MVKAAMEVSGGMTPTWWWLSVAMALVVVGVAALGKNKGGERECDGVDDGGGDGWLGNVGGLVLSSTAVDGNVRVVRFAPPPPQLFFFVQRFLILVVP